jgi:dihydrofolate reductase/transposase
VSCLARAHHVETDPPDNRRQPGPQVVNSARVGAAEADPRFLDGVVRIGVQERTATHRCHPGQLDAAVEAPEAARGGYDRPKRREGAKAHAAVDTSCHVLALVVTPANDHNRAQVGHLAAALHEAPDGTAELAYVDQGYTGAAPVAEAAPMAWSWRSSSCPTPNAALCRCRAAPVVERDFVWASRFRRLARDYERRAATLVSLQFLAFAGCLLQHLLHLVGRTRHALVSVKTLTRGCPHRRVSFVVCTTMATRTKEMAMHRVLVVEFVTLDGVMQDPDGADATPGGGWAFRYGRAAVAGDPFRLGEALDTGILLLGRATWQRFAMIWPSRTDGFSAKMNRISKLVVSRTLDRVDAWNHSALVRGDLVDEVLRRKETQDVVVMGSLSIVRMLMARDLVDEYRLLVFPTVLGEGSRLFGDQSAPIELELAVAERVGPAVLSVYRREIRPAGREGES